MQIKAITHGAITLMNAIATTHGSAIGINAKTKVTIESASHFTTNLSHNNTDELVISTIQVIDSIYNQDIASHQILISVETPFPPARGLKTSSSVSNALVIALLRYLREKQLITQTQFSPSEIINLAAKASKIAGVTITGAYDDAYASLIGGVVLTENSTGDLIIHKDIPPSIEPLRLFLLLPRVSNPKRNIRQLLTEVDTDLLQKAQKYIIAGEYMKASKWNTQAYAPFLLQNAEIIGDLGRISEHVGLNGAGPSLFLIARDEEVHSLKSYVNSTYQEYSLVEASFNQRRQVNGY